MVLNGALADIKICCDNLAGLTSENQFHDLALSRSEACDVVRRVKHRDVLHKIGVTGNKVETRIVNAKLDPTFLMADVGSSPPTSCPTSTGRSSKTSSTKSSIPARLDIEIKDRFGNLITPREWFLVPVFVIDEAVQRIKDGTITDYRYDPKKAALVRAGRMSMRASSESRRMR